jgi:preprotein translocase subunit SecG
MYTLFVILIVLASFLMIGIVLIQESKGGGLASNFSSSNAIMGVRKTTDFIEKATWGLAIAMVIISVLCSYVAPTASTSESVIENSATQSNSTNPNNLPGFGASQTKQAAPAANGGAQSAPAQGGQQSAPAAPKAPATPQN